MFRLYRILITASIRAQMQYKFHFVAASVTTGLIMTLDFLVLSAILYRFDHVKGWGIYEVGMLYGVASVAMSLYRMFAPELHEFERYIIQGEFDQILLRPVSPLLLLLTRNIELMRIGGVVQGMAILGVSLFGLAAAGKDVWFILGYLPIAVVSGGVICFSIDLMTAAAAFWIQQIKELQIFTFYAPFSAANYPLSLYPNWLKGLFFTVIPVAFVNYVPMLYLLDKGGPWCNLLLSPLVAILFLLVAIRIWNLGIRHYHSTGS
jgi:ABC-2 type transport system permease protein